MRMQGGDFMGKPMPVGVDDFAKARQQYYFVDKTKFLCDFWPNHADVTLLTRPRRFGKTITQSMLYYFFSCEHAEEHRRLFDGLRVADYPDIMEHQGQYPVVFLTLKDWKYNSWEELQAGISLRLQDFFQDKRFFLDSEKISEDDKRQIRIFLAGESKPMQNEMALSFLLRLYSTFYGRKVILLIDEYDAPTQQAFEHGYYDHAVAFMRNFLSVALKSNPLLEFAVLTGVLRIAKESIFSALNNLEVSSLLNGTYADAMGFTEEDVQKIAADYQKEDKLPEIKKWYDGYHFGATDIYNPWSVVNYFAHRCEPDFYWINTSGNGIIKELMMHADTRTLERVREVLSGHPIDAILEEGLIYPDIYSTPDSLFTMLLTTGYLTAVQMKQTMLGRLASLCIPNLEVMSVYRVEILRRFQRRLQITDMEKLMQALLCGKEGAVQDGLSYYLEVLASTFDTGGRESFYHGFVLGMTAMLVPDYEVRSNRESGRGRYDIAVFPKEKGRSGVLLEFKVAGKGEKLETKAGEALEQIEAKDYISEFRERSIHVVYSYGIAFCGKELFVKMRKNVLTAV